MNGVITIGNHIKQRNNPIFLTVLLLWFSTKLYGIIPNFSIIHFPFSIGCFFLTASVLAVVPVSTFVLYFFICLYIKFCSSLSKTDRQSAKRYFIFYKYTQ